MLTSIVAFVDIQTDVEHEQHQGTGLGAMQFVIVDVP